MKRILSLIIAAASVICASAADYYYIPMTVNATNALAATSTNSYTTQLVMDAQKYKEVGIAVSLKLTGAGTTPVIFSVQESLDGSTWATTPKHVFSVTPAGTAERNVVTNITANAVGYFRISAIQNDNSAAVTNLSVVYSLKAPYAQ